MKYLNIVQKENYTRNKNTYFLYKINIKNKTKSIKYPLGIRFAFHSKKFSA